MTVVLTMEIPNEVIEKEGKTLTEAMHEMREFEDEIKRDAPPGVKVSMAIQI